MPASRIDIARIKVLVLQSKLCAVHILIVKTYFFFLFVIKIRNLM